MIIGELSSHDLLAILNDLRSEEYQNQFKEDQMFVHD